ncbi:hypothetical protein EMCRGX_G026508 [Ephydatia muelleri]
MVFVCSKVLNCSAGAAALNLAVLGQCCSQLYGFTIHLYAIFYCFLYFAHSTSARSAETCWEINSVIATSGFYIACFHCWSHMVVLMG